MIKVKIVFSEGFARVSLRGVMKTVACPTTPEDVANFLIELIKSHRSIDSAVIVLKEKP